jgi:hypothetical protein
MKLISVTRSELETIKKLPVRFRPDWPAVFNTNTEREIWLWRRWGNTPSNEREEIRGKSRIVDAIADEYLCQRRSGGRFSINDKGAFYSPEFLRMKLPNVTIVKFEVVD